MLQENCKPHCSGILDSIELKKLKKELAELQCHCSACGILDDPKNIYRVYNDVSIQVDKQKSPLHKSIFYDNFAHPSSNFTEDSINKEVLMGNYLENSCQHCYFIWKIINRLSKVFKDEETETNQMSSLDKCTGKHISSVDIATSINEDHSDINSLAPNGNYTSNRSSDASCRPLNKTKSFDRVTFVDHCVSNFVEPQPMHGNCYCLENYIESIRPPLSNFQANVNFLRN